ncbi:MAG: hypothetical protein FWB74_06160 [Defluviitaleaceae bacterium]|nr:hypothetical protein [Defluviitaleaceae bacterium]
MAKEDRILELLEVIVEDIAVLKADVYSLKEGQASMKADIVSMKADIVSMKADIADLREGQTRIEERLDKNEKRIEEVLRISQRIELEYDLQIKALWDNSYASKDIVDKVHGISANILRAQSDYSSRLSRLEMERMQRLRMEEVDNGIRPPYERECDCKKSKATS